MSSTDYEATVVIAQTLKRLYPQNPDIVFGREARTIVAALSDAGWQPVTDLFVSVTESIKAENEQLRSMLAQVFDADTWSEIKALQRAFLSDAVSPSTDVGIGPTD